MANLPTPEPTLDDLWLALFTLVDMQLELWQQGQLRDAVEVRRRCRLIGAELRKRYAITSET